VFLLECVSHVTRWTIGVLDGLPPYMVMG
jgi:hypothetical protein